MASSTFQVALGPGGVLSAIEFKQNTSAVGQQVAAGAGAAAAQAYNIQSGQVVAAQTAVNTAQSAYDTQKSATDAIQAQLNADQSAANPNPTNIAQDVSNLAQANAKLQDAQTVLDRTRNTAQAVSVTASAGSPITTAPLAPGTTGFGPQTWVQPTPYDLPENHGAVLYKIVEGTETNPKTHQAESGPWLEAVDYYNSSKQPDFETVAFALGSPTLQPQNMRYPTAGKTAVFFFNRPVETVSKTSQSLTMVTPKDPAATVGAFDITKYATLSANQYKQLELPIDYLTAGQYTLTVFFNADSGHSYTAPVTFTVY
jgi:hypothetical protein